MDDQRNLAILVERAHRDSEKQKVISETRFAGELKYWGIVYHVLGDKEAGDLLFDEVIEILDAQISGRPCPVVTDTRSLWTLSSEDSDLFDAYRFKNEALFVRTQIQREGPLVNPDRQTIVNMSLEDLSILKGMNQYFQSLSDAERIASGEQMPYFHPNFMTEIRGTRRPMFEHRVFAQELPKDIVDEATRLARDYYDKVDVLSTSGSRFDREHSVLFHRDWASVVRKVYLDYIHRLGIGK